MSATDDPVGRSSEDRAPDGAPAPGTSGRRGDLDGDGRLDARERFGVLKEAAIQAEYATGRHEDTEEEAKRHVALRIGTIIVGFVVLFGGLAMMILPGPGIIGIIAGLGILSRELTWAERMLEYAKEKARVDELKEQPTWVKAGAWAITIGAVAASAWYLFLADPKPELTEALPWNWD
ncbi:MAG TPA: PGPGW domain-containing protein [Acidimicrobiales bacterium]|nr:PGPGW domain-containing protein [Acidimicrobiales bacterium]